MITKGIRMLNEQRVDMGDQSFFLRAGVVNVYSEYNEELIDEAFKSLMDEARFHLGVLSSISGERYIDIAIEDDYNGGAILSLDLHISGIKCFDLVLKYNSIGNFTASVNGFYWSHRVAGLRGHVEPLYSN